MTTDCRGPLPDRPRERFGNFLYPLLHLVWPAACPVCGRLGALVCGDCLRSLLRVPPPVCLECGGGWPCVWHRSEAGCSAGTMYGDASRSVVHTMKYRGGRSVARRMGRLLAGAVARPEADFLVPVPLHRGSRRGYNQAELIAEGAGEVWGIPVRSMLEWRLRVESQAQKAGREARALPAGSVSAGRGFVPGARVCLVDDVCTTGNTMRAARDAILRGGASVEGALVWSRGGQRAEDMGGKTDGA